MARSCSNKEKDAVVEKSFNDMKVHLSRFDCLVIGPGLGRDELLPADRHQSDQRSQGK